MGGQGKKKRVMAPADEVDLAAVKYQPQNIQAPHLTGFLLKLFVWMMESPLFGPIIISSLKAQNKMNQLLRYTVIPEQPMYRPEFPPQEPEGVVIVDEERDPIELLETANHCLPITSPPVVGVKRGLHLSIGRSEILHMLTALITTPSLLAEQLIAAIEEWNDKKPPMPMMIYFSSVKVRKEAEASMLHSGSEK
ncbi:hypothetical protein LUZ60_016071 [Juncus effusus]|nr:hypothetical protein LUZ60_016071 [Juncus effusus]